MTEEYLRRNLVVAKAYGVQAGISAILKRLSANKRQPQWILNLLGWELSRMDDVINEAVKHRDEVSHDTN